MQYYDVVLFEPVDRNDRVHVYINCNQQATLDNERRSDRGCLVRIEVKGLQVESREIYGEMFITLRYLLLNYAGKGYSSVIKASEKKCATGRNDRYALTRRE